MGMSSEVSTVFKGSANQAPAITEGKYWQDSLSWQPLPANIAKFNLTCDTVDASETLSIPSTYQYIVSSLHNNGKIINNGKMVIV